VKNLSLLLPLTLLSVAVTRQAAADAYPRADLLIEPAELAKPEVARQFVILDARAQDAYQQEHIPAARRVDHDAWAKAFGDGQDVDSWSKRIGELGIGGDSKVVIYDDKTMKDAARIWWILRYWNVHDVRLLNGGWQAWNVQLFPTESAMTAAIPPIEFKAHPRSERLANKPQMLDMLNKPVNSNAGYQVVDARSEKEFCGIDAQTNKRAGSIPGALHLEWSDLIDPQTHGFKSPDALRTLFEKAGIDLTQPTTCHCQSGGRASVMVFGLELMGAKDVRNYYRGWSEWGNATDTPVVTTSHADTK
jgi:thiosulfate/3-mercaptopyruvate sulfurtransferase